LEIIALKPKGRGTEQRYEFPSGPKAGSAAHLCRT
jgi:hypothetical protein